MLRTDDTVQHRTVRIGRVPGISRRIAPSHTGVVRSAVGPGVIVPVQHDFFDVTNVEFEFERLSACDYAGIVPPVVTEIRAGTSAREPRAVLAGEAVRGHVDAACACRRRRPCIGYFVFFNHVCGKSGVGGSPTSGRSTVVVDVHGITLTLRFGGVPRPTRDRGCPREPIIIGIMWCPR